MNSTITELPPSPDRPGWGKNYSPSNDTPNGWAEFVGRYRARIIHGQDPQKNPELFTPQAKSSPLKWPTNEEAYQWVDSFFQQQKKPKKLAFHDTPAATSGSSTSPVTGVAGEPPTSRAPRESSPIRSLPLE